MASKNDATDVERQGLQAAVVATEYLCEITTALGLDPSKDNIENIFSRIKELIAAEEEYKNLLDFPDVPGDDA